MNGLIRGFIESRVEPPPMPPEAFPPGLVGRAPAVHAAMEIAWKSMGYQMFCNGLMVGGVLVLAIVIGIVCRGQINAFIKSLAINAH